MKIRPFVVFFLFVSIVLWSCRQKPGGPEEIIAQLERSLSSPPTLQQAEALIEAYQNYASTYPDRHKKNAQYLNKAAELAVQVQLYSKAVELLNVAIKNHDEPEVTLDNVRLLGKIYSELDQNEHLKAAVYHSAATRYPDEEEFKQASRSAFSERLKQLRSEVFDENGIPSNFQAINNYINASTTYAMIIPRDTLSPRLLFRAGQLAHQTQTYKRALEILDWLAYDYPDHPRAADALFLAGFLLDNELKRFDEAKIKYETFLERFPDHEYAEMTRQLIKNLGIPEEEIIKRFEEK